jgi:hypothetical protein
MFKEHNEQFYAYKFDMLDKMHCSFKIYKISTLAHGETHNLNKSMSIIQLFKY